MNEEKRKTSWVSRCGKNISFCPIVLIWGWGFSVLDWHLSSIHFHHRSQTSPWRVLSGQPWTPLMGRSCFQLLGKMEWRVFWCVYSWCLLTVYCVNEQVSILFDCLIFPSSVDFSPSQKLPNLFLLLLFIGYLSQVPALREHDREEPTWIQQGCPQLFPAAF